MQNHSDINNSNDQGNDSPVNTFVGNLSQEERMLIVLLEELYDGSWQAMKSDLQNRLNGKPYIFKLANRIKDDINRIEKLQDYEANNSICLRDFVKPPANPAK